MTKNDFYVTGQFSEKLIFKEDSLTTTTPYDNDGFFLKLGSDGESYWLKQFGTPGVIKKAYKTYEGGFDLAFDKDGNVIVLAIMNIVPKKCYFCLKNQKRTKQEDSIFH